MQLESPVFRNNAVIPEDYTQHGKNLSPPFVWQDVPEEAQELVLICEDLETPKSSPYVHWLVYNLPADRRQLPAGAAQNEKDFLQGQNSANKTGYVGPNPPPKTGSHHYRFRLYALDMPLNMPPGATRQEMMSAMEGHVIAEASYVGLQHFH